MQKHYHPKGKFFCTMYFCVDCKSWEKIKDQSIEKDYIAIQVGHSATITNNHIHIFNQLSQFKDENIKVYVPLSYGDKSYAEKVIKKGKEMFGEKIIVLSEFLSEDEYNCFLNSIDIAIFDTKRQQALGNICKLLYLGKKVYLRDRSVLLHYFKISNGCVVYKTRDISRIKYNEFVSFSATAKEINKEKLISLLKPEVIIKEWNRIFND